MKKIAISITVVLATTAWLSPSTGWAAFDITASECFKRLLAARWRCDDAQDAKAICESEYGLGCSGSPVCQKKSQAAIDAVWNIVKKCPFEGIPCKWSAEAQEAKASEEADCSATSTIALNQQKCREAVRAAYNTLPDTCPGFDITSAINFKAMCSAKSKEELLNLRKDVMQTCNNVNSDPESQAVKDCIVKAKTEYKRCLAALPVEEGAANPSADTVVGFAAELLAQLKKLRADDPKRDFEGMFMQALEVVAGASAGEYDGVVGMSELSKWGAKCRDGVCPDKETCDKARKYFKVVAISCNNLEIPPGNMVAACLAEMNKYNCDRVEKPDAPGANVGK